MEVVMEVVMGGIKGEHLILDVEVAASTVDFVSLDISDANVDCEACTPDPGDQECRICQEEDNFQNLEIPCACSGTLKYAHRKCVQQWCDEKGNMICEICHHPYTGGYKGPPGLPRFEMIPFDGVWGIIGSNPMNLAAADRHPLEAEDDEFIAAVDSGSACCRSAALILIALLFFRVVLWAAVGTQGNTYELALFILVDFCLKTAGFLLICYIMTHAINILERQRRWLDANVLAAARLAIRIQQAGQARANRVQQAPQTRGMQDAVAPASAPAHELP